MGDYRGSRKATYQQGVRTIFSSVYLLFGLVRASIEQHLHTGSVLAVVLSYDCRAVALWHGLLLSIGYFIPFDRFLGPQLSDEPALYLYFLQVHQASAGEPQANRLHHKLYLAFLLLRV